MLRAKEEDSKGLRTWKTVEKKNDSNWSYSSSTSRTNKKKIQEQFLRYSLSTLYKTTRIYERQRKHSGNSKQELKLVVWSADVLLICRLHRGSLFTSGRLLLTRKARGIFSRSEKKPDEKRVTRDSRSFSFACWANAEFEVIFFPARMHTPNPQTQQ